MAVVPSSPSAVAITFDKLLEAGLYAQELQGGTKPPESLANLLRAASPPAPAAVGLPGPGAGGAGAVFYFVVCCTFQFLAIFAVFFLHFGTSRPLPCFWLPL